MKRILLLLLIFPVALLSQVRLLSFDAGLKFSDSATALSGTVAFRWNATDEQRPFEVRIPEGMNVLSVRNAANEPLEYETIPPGGEGFSTLSIETEEAFGENDTGLCSIQFLLPSVNTPGRAQLNHREMLLFANDSMMWLPHIPLKIPEHYSLSIESPRSMLLLQQQWNTIDTLERSIVRLNRSSAPDSFYARFTLFGFVGVEEFRSEESGLSVSLYSPPGLIDGSTAVSLVRLMNDARVFFQKKTGIAPTLPHRKFFFTATDSTSRDPIVLAPGVELFRSPEMIAEFDTLYLKSSRHHRWIGVAAEEYCTPFGSTETVLREGFRRYLTVRFSESRGPEYRQEDRFALAADVLTFYPFPSIHEAEDIPPAAFPYYSSKAAYLFLMLEYLAGDDVFDAAVKRWLEGHSSAPLTWEGLRTIIEPEYGTPVPWFFDQWLKRTGLPDLVMQWKSEKTVRGTHIVKVTVEQRGELFTVPLPIVFSFGARTVTKRIVVEQSKQDFTFTFSGAPTGAEMDPHGTALRWLRELRIPAHARSALQFLSLAADTVNAEREARYTLELDPTNATGSAPPAYDVLGTIATARGDLDGGAEYFFKAISSDATTLTAGDRLRSLLRYGNVTELSGKRNEAVTIYQRVLREASVAPARHRSIIRQAQYFLRNSFTITDWQRHD